MKLTPITIDLSAYPTDLHPLLSGGEIYDSSCSPQARVLFIDKDGGYFLKSAAKGTLSHEATMTRYFHGKGMAANVMSYTSDTQDWLLTEKIHGDDCVAAKYLEHPKRLCDTLAERLALLHTLDYADCPVQNYTERMIERATRIKHAGTYNTEDFPDNFGYATANEAWAVVQAHSHVLRNDTLLHGDYCLPNVILNNWQFAGFIDLDGAGVGDRHVDVFWATWSLFFNLHTHEYRERFIDACGRDKIDEDVLRVVAAIEVFG